MLNIVLTGDFYPSEKILSSNWSDKLFDDNIKQILDDATLVVANLESPLTHHEKGIFKTGPNLKSSIDAVQILLHANVKLVTLANNHIYDYGKIGLQDTLDTCSKNNIMTVGADLSLEKAQKVYYHKLNEVTVAFVNFSENEFSTANRYHGGANPMDLVDNLRAIKIASEISDYVIVIIHGGHELYKYPSPMMVKLYRFLAEQNVDAVVGHQTHCIGGYEVWNGTPIFYSLGNFLFESNTKFDGWYTGMLLRLNFDEKTKLKFELIPYSQCEKEMRVEVLETDRQKEIFKMQEDINNIIVDKEKLNKVWDEFILRKEKGKIDQFSMFSSQKSRLVHFIKKRYPRLAENFYNKNNLNLLRNNFRCESLREVNLEVLERFLRL